MHCHFNVLGEQADCTKPAIIASNKRAPASSSASIIVEKQGTLNEFPLYSASGSEF